MRFPFRGHAEAGISQREVPRYALRGLSWQAKSVDDPAGNRRVAVDAPVAKKRPVAARVFKQAKIHFSNQDFFFIVRSFRHHFARTDRK